MSFIVGAPRKAWRIWSGESPGMVRVNHPPLSSVAPLAERRYRLRKTGATREGVWLALLHNAAVVSCGKASFVWESKGRPLCLEKPLRSETEEPPVFRPEGLAEPAKEAAHRGRLLLRTAPRLCWFMERCFGGSW